MSGPSEPSVTIAGRSAAATAERSRVYQALRLAFTYPDDADSGGPSRPGGGGGAGSAFLEAFDPAVSASARSLHEADHSGAERTTLFEELLRFYAYFGLTRTAASELPDHLTVELEFLHFLTFLQHRSELEGRLATDLVAAQHDFLSRHLLRLSRGIADGFSSDDPRYRELVGSLSAFVEQEAELLAGMATGTSRSPRSASGQDG